MGNLKHVESGKIKMTKELHQLTSLRVQLLDSNDGGVVILNTTESSLIAEVQER